MKKWEYFYFSETYDYGSKKWSLDFYHQDEKKRIAHLTAERCAILDNLGKEGWELVSIKSNIDSDSPWGSGQVFTRTNQYTYFFKRELEDE